MGANTRKIRLDEILMREGFIDKNQVAEALLRQKAHGGKFGSQLLYHRYIDEPTLVKALSIQFECEGIVLSEIEIPDSVIKLIHPRLVTSRKIIPFEYDAKANILKVACIDPSDPNVINEVSFMAPGKKVKFYVAAELAIETAIEKYYLGRKTKLDDNLLIDIPEVVVETSGKPVPNKQIQAPDKAGSSKSILIITDEEYNASLLQSIFERDSYKVHICENIEKAGEYVDRERFCAVLIRDTLEGDFNNLVDRIRRNSPQTLIQKYKTTSSLILGDDDYAGAEDILKRNLDLFTSMLSSKDSLPENHSGMVGRNVDKLCRKLGIPLKDRLTVTNAGYIHDLAKYYYREIDPKDYHAIIGFSIKLLESLDYTPSVIGILKAMYKDLKGEYAHNLPLEILGGNILTIVDLFCENIPFDQRLTLDKFDAVKKRLRDLSGKLFLSEVVEAFISMIQEEILNIQTIGNVGQIMLYTNDPQASYPLELRLKNEGFRNITENSLEAFAELYHRSRPDIIILSLRGEPEKIIDAIDELARLGLEYKKTPTFLLVDISKSSKLAPLFEKGIEDVISNDANYDLLIVKMRKIQAHLEEEARQSIDPKSANNEVVGARGRLSDMNLIDLTQALAPGRRTVKITVINQDSSDDKLIIYLNKGSIVFAQLNDKKGPMAIYEGMAWSDGAWVVEPITPDNIPEPNNDLSNDAILMEGAYQLDERVRAGKLV